MWIEIKLTFLIRDCKYDYEPYMTVMGDYKYVLPTGLLDVPWPHDRERDQARLHGRFRESRPTSFSQGKTAAIYNLQRLFSILDDGYNCKLWLLSL
jgi:hypothetical protein